MERELEKLLFELNYKIVCGDIKNAAINNVVYDTRKISKNDLFICLNGARFDSHSKFEELLDSNVSVIIIEENNKYFDEFKKNSDKIIISVKNTRIALAIISKNYFENPAKNMEIIGITGTKGKTTTAFMIKKVLEDAGKKVGMIGTVGIFYDNEHIETDNTTPESYILQEYFYKMKASDVKYVVMEVSSQSLKYNRVCGINFDYAIWTNITPEHIGEHEHTDYNDYLNSKLLIFSNCKKAIINGDTNELQKIIDKCKINNVEYIIKNDNIDITLKIPGSHNIENASIVYTFAKTIGINDNIIYNALMKVKVPGRTEIVYEDNNVQIIVDYSYEPMGAEKLFYVIKEYAKEIGGKHRIVAVFGCGGNRSIDRRTGMGDLCGKEADFIILTADNSRYEKTIDIIADIEKTLTKHKKKNDLENGYIIIEDRREAIKYAIKNKKPGDIICIMGKGHETTNEVNGIKTHFSDKEEVLNALARND